MRYDSITDLPEQWQKQVRDKDRAAVSSTNMEQGACNEQVAKKKIARLDRSVSVHFHSIRKRLTDADGAFTKYILDALVDAGVFQDDSTKWIEEVSHSQEKGKEERTVIEIWITN